MKITSYFTFKGCGYESVFLFVIAQSWNNGSFFQGSYAQSSEFDNDSNHGSRVSLSSTDGLERVSVSKEYSNMWGHDIGRVQATNKPLLKTAFQVEYLHLHFIYISWAIWGHDIGLVQAANKPLLKTAFQADAIVSKLKLSGDHEKDAKPSILIASNTTLGCNLKALEQKIPNTSEFLRLELVCFHFTVVMTTACLAHWEEVPWEKVVTCTYQLGLYPILFDPFSIIADKDVDYQTKEEFHGIKARNSLQMVSRGRMYRGYPGRNVGDGNIGTEMFPVPYDMGGMLPRDVVAGAMLQPMPITALASALANAPLEQQSP
ncbi:polyadenylate-binding protein 2-like protein [Tanacetum coccineum]